MFILKFVSNVKILVIRIRKKCISSCVFKGCGIFIKGVKGFIENNFPLVCSWCDVRQCGIYEMLFLNMILPSFEDTLLFCNFCIFSVDTF